MNQSKTGSERQALERILHTPDLARVVPHLRPELLHRVIQQCGLEECVELLPLVTAEQLTTLFDLDLWRGLQPGERERFDAQRFGAWIEVLLEAGPAVAAEKLAAIDVDLVIAGLAQHVRVFDAAAVADYTTISGDVVETNVPDDLPTADVAGYVVAARRVEAWDAVVAVLQALAEARPSRFHEVMAGCRGLSNSRPEIDGLDDLLEQGDQAMLDVGIDRERRRERQGYVTADEARAFLMMSRTIDPASAAASNAANPIAEAYVRTVSDARTEILVARPEELPAAPVAAKADVASPEESVSVVLEVLVDAGLLEREPRGLLPPAQPNTPTLARIRAWMEVLQERDPSLFAKRFDELVFLANALKAGCAVQGRAFTSQESWDAAVAVCNLGLEIAAPAGEPVAARNLVGLFQAGWTALHDDVVMESAAGLVAALKSVRCPDRGILLRVHGLRFELTKQLRSGTPWRARESMDILAALDQWTCAQLLGLIAEYPVLVSAGAGSFEFISEKRQILAVHAFVSSLAGTLAK